LVSFLKPLDVFDHIFPYIAAIEIYAGDQKGEREHGDETDCYACYEA
jgi:hypothetical protein